MCARNVNVKQREGNSITLNLLDLYAKRVLAYPFQVNDIHSVILHTNIFDVARRKRCDGVNGILMQQELNSPKQDYWNRRAIASLANTLITVVEPVPMPLLSSMLLLQLWKCPYETLLLYQHLS
jgi:hypothetical protein